MANVNGKNHQIVKDLFAGQKNNVLKDGGTVLINSARIYCGAMDQVSSMGYPRVGLGTKLQFTSIYLL